MAFIIIDEVGIENGDSDVREYATLDLVADALRETGTNYDTDTRWGQSEFARWSESVTVYETVRRVPVNIDRGEFSVSFNEPGNIPPPLPGESVTDYARRITNG